MLLNAFFYKKLPKLKPIAKQKKTKEEYYFMLSMQHFQKISKEFLQTYFHLARNFLVIYLVSSTVSNIVSSTLGDFLAFLALDFPADRCPGKLAEISY